MAEIVTLRDKVTKVRDMLNGGAMQEAFRQASRMIDPGLVASAALSACRKVPGLLDCTPASFVGALMQATQMGLVIDGRQAALVPFNDSRSGTKIATLLPMYQGLNQLAYRSELIASINTEVVREFDSFDCVLGTSPSISHRHPKPGDDRGEMIGAYAVIETTTGGQVSEWMDKGRIMAVKAKSRSSGRSDSPWNDQQSEPWMWRKTVLKAALKNAPQSYEISRALTLDDQAEVGKPQDLPVVEIPIESVTDAEPKE